MVHPMQQYCSRWRIFFCHSRIVLATAIFSCFAVGAGCIERPTTVDPSFSRPHSGIVLTASASDPRDRALLEHLSKSWDTRSGAKIQILDTPFDGAADIGLIAPAELSRWAEPGSIANVPVEIKSQTHAYRWDDLLRPYSVRLTNWRDQTCALPVIGEGMVLIYRKGNFDGKDNRPTSPPGTWDEFVDAASRLGKGSLPPLPADADRLGAEFFTAAACYDRQAVGRVSTEELIRDSGRFFSFQFDAMTGEPRLNSPAFKHVASLFQRMQAFRSSAKDIATAFRSGEAKLGIVSLSELAQFSVEMGDQFGIAAIPGANFTFETDGTQRPTDQRTVNRVPYYGWGGRIGVVSANCQATAAAWDFLADAGMPDTTALELVANTKWGAGTYRNSQLDTRARPKWFAYGLSAAQTDRLTAALNENLGSNVLNYRVRLRTPNQHELAAALDEELRRIIMGKSPADLSAANERWLKIIDRQPRAQWKAVAAKSLGI